jgi:catechol 2,3-dioxygenase-like lactoylglutathione lyase family enzyme
MFKETHPILGTLDIQRAIAFYTQQLGFKLAFGDKADPPNYVGFRRDAVELHMQFQFEHEMGKPRHPAELGPAPVSPKKLAPVLIND